jgi:hypothetical protein
VLAVCVLDDLDIEPNRAGVRLTGEPTVFVSWAECRRALGAVNPETDGGRQRLSRWLHARRWAADHTRRELHSRLRPVGLPVGHALHPGAEWVRRTVLGDALDLGLGAVDLDPTDPDRVVVLPPPVLRAMRLDAELAWQDAEHYLERMGQVATTRLDLDARGSIRPVGDCDVVTLLGARSLRRALCARAHGLATIVAPMRTRGWTRLALIDPAFAPAAWAATDPEARGFPRPAMVTLDEVVVAAPGGHPEDLLLRDPAVHDDWQRDVLYR